MRIAITGGTGFVGRHFAERFDSDDVVVVSRRTGVDVEDVDALAAAFETAKRAGARKIIMLSFLRAQPNCGSDYHESKWAAEELIRASGLDYTILKAGMIYGRGDHLIDHFSHTANSFHVASPGRSSGWEACVDDSSSSLGPHCARTGL